ncbi:5,10-methylenetetrahydrofolate reductase [Roseovarius albus]|uniref:Methylenetetrahydrofolate reductase n=1 Tax=Roseovarius albus TaxID=1247867 RepID=A0A1X6YLV5_9RHOB|nr:methylenetetrahydrofolate reductase [NAD(P)H] [Roseovarius albus]SLN24800.1 5,10-methylenetetrahydrofolate reductase [Roseovarius albus]
MTTPKISFEFFPPRSLEASFRLWDTAMALAPFSPDFVSVTYGAGGTTRKLTQETVSALHNTTDLNVAAHLTCVDASREETLEIAKQFAREGVTEITALRGDPPAGTGPFQARKDGFANSCELVDALARTGNFKIRVGAYPEVHPEAANQAADIDWLKRKIDAGASEIITQFFFEADVFFRFRDACDKAGITVPILPGILPIENWKNARAFSQRCGASIPDWLDQAFDKALRDDREQLLATSVATELCTDLIEGGVEQLHFYTLNRPELTRNICLALGLKTQQALRHVA